MRLPLAEACPLSPSWYRAPVQEMAQMEQPTELASSGMRASMSSSRPTTTAGEQV